jgi:hypothetical protein
MTENNNSTTFTKFSFFKPITLTNKSFSWKIAILNTIGFCLIAYIDTSSSQFARIQINTTIQGLKAEDVNTMQQLIIKRDNIPRCFWEYWILLWAIPLGLGNYFLSRLKYWLPQILSPFLLTIAICWFVSLINFTPPSPNLWQMWIFAIFPLFGLAASVIRYYEPAVKKNLAEVNLKATIAWVTENSNMWRTLGIGSVIPLIAFLAFWWPLIASWLNSYPDPQRGFLFPLWATVGAYVVLYSFLGPIYECVLQAEHIRNRLLEIKKNAYNEGQRGCRKSQYQRGKIATLFLLLGFGA